MFHGASCRTLCIVEKLSMRMGALTWFEIVWSYDVEAIDYWIIFRNEKTKENRNWKLYWNFWALLVLLEPTWEPDGGLRVAPFLIPAQPRVGVFLRENCCVWVLGFAEFRVLCFCFCGKTFRGRLFCFVLFVCLFGCCCGAWEWESFIARYVWRRRWCAGDGTLLLFFFVLFSEVEKTLNWFFFLRMGKLGSPERVATAVWSLLKKISSIVSYSFPQGSKRL